MAEHPKSKATGGFYQADVSPCRDFGVPWPWVKLFCLGELLEPLCTILTVSLGSIFQVLPRPIKFGIEVSKEGARALKLLCPPMKAYWTTERGDSCRCQILGNGYFILVSRSTPSQNCSWIYPEYSSGIDTSYTLK